MMWNIYAHGMDEMLVVHEDSVILADEYEVVNDIVYFNHRGETVGIIQKKYVKLPEE